MARTDVRPTGAEQGESLPVHPSQEADGADSKSAQPAEPALSSASRGQAAVAALLAWLIPGAGHLYLGRRGRALLFSALVGSAFLIGIVLDGKLWQLAGQEPPTFLQLLGTLGCVGLGIPYFLLRLIGYQGDLLSTGYEYGGAFLLTAGIMNLLLVLDAWDLARGVKP